MPKQISSWAGFGPSSNAETHCASLQRCWANCNSALACGGSSYWSYSNGLIHFSSFFLKPASFPEHLQSLHLFLEWVEAKVWIIQLLGCKVSMVCPSKKRAELEAGSFLTGFTRIVWTWCFTKHIPRILQDSPKFGVYVFLILSANLHWKFCQKMLQSRRWTGTVAEIGSPFPGTGTAGGEFLCWCAAQYVGCLYNRICTLFISMMGIKHE